MQDEVRGKKYEVKFVCKHCSKTATLRTNINKLDLNIKCLCGEKSTVKNEKRKYQRKTYSAPGIITISKTGASVPVEIENLSENGLRIKLPKEVGHYKLFPGTELEIQYKIKSKDEEKVFAEVFDSCVVVNANKKSVGLMITSSPSIIHQKIKKWWLYLTEED